MRWTEKENSEERQGRWLEIDREGRGERDAEIIGRIERV